MSLAHAVLTSLIEKPSSGSELARRFDKSIGYFWHATHQQIYRELARMEEKGWIVSDSAPERRCYPQAGVQGAAGRPGRTGALDQRTCCAHGFAGWVAPSKSALMPL